ncbi:putative ribonuclease H-like domain-containing protein [Tanacetum coccineum]
MVPRAVLMKSSSVSPNTARQVNTAHSKPIVNTSRPMTHIFKTTHLTVKRPIHKETTFKNSNNSQRVNTASTKNFSTASTKNVNTARPKAVVNAVNGNNAVKASASRTPQQNGVGKRRNRTPIKAARTMLVNSKLPTTFWAEAVNTACYVQNRVLVVKPHNKTSYELFNGRPPILSFMRPFGCPVTILNTIDHLGKFDGKADEESTPNVVSSGPDWLFDIDALTRIMNCNPNVVGTQSNGFAGTKTRMETESVQRYILLPLWKVDPPLFQDPKSSQDIGFPPPRTESESEDQERGNNVSNTNNENIVSSTNNVNTASTNKVNIADRISSIELLDDPSMPSLENNSIFDYSHDEDVGAEPDISNLDSSIQVSSIPTIRIHKDHPLDQVIGDLKATTTTRRMSKSMEEHGFVGITLKQRKNHKNIQFCLFTCFLSQEPKKVAQALEDPSWIEVMQEELLQFKLQEVWILVELPNRIRAIGTKWVFRNKKDERAIRLFLAYASFKDFVVYQMNVKSSFLYGKIEEEVYVCQPPGFDDPDFPDRVYKVEKALYGLHQAPRAWHKDDILLVQVYVDDIILGSTKKELCTKFENLIHEKFQMSSMGELTFFLGLQVKQKNDGIFISQDKYVAEILKKFDYKDVRIASTPMDTKKALLKDSNGDDVDVHLYRLMIGSLMYLTSFRPDIMFAVCACTRFQVTPKVSHLHAVKRIFRTATASTNAHGQVELTARIDGQVKTITEASLRRHLKLEDNDGIPSLPNS